MEELEDLKRILDSDEMVLESFKPNKKRYVWISMIFTGGLFLLFVLIFFLLGILSLVDVIKITDENGNKDIMPSIILLLMGGLPLLFHIISVVGIFFRYKRTIYVITNKRIVIRSGFIGVDYKSLDLKNVISVDVRVDFMDKLVHPNTGTIIFGTAIHTTNNNSHQANLYSFNSVDEPYEVFKKVKEHLN